MDYDYNVEYSQTWSGGLQYELVAVDDGRSRRTWARGRSAPTTRTIRNVPEPGPAPIQARRPIPQLSRINAIRFDGKSIYHGLTLKTERRLRERLRLQRQLHALDLEGRCLEPGRHRSRKPTCRRTCGTSSTRPASGRTRASITGISSSPAASIELPFFARVGGVAKRCWAAGASMRSSPRSRARRSRSTSASIAPTSAPGRRSGPTSFAIRTCRAASERPNRWFDTCGLRVAGAVHLRQRAAQQRASAPASPTSIWPREDVERRGQLAAGVPLGGLQSAQPGEFRPAQPHLRHAELRPHLQRQESARDAVRPAPGVLISSGYRLAAGCQTAVTSVANQLEWVWPADEIPVHLRRNCEEADIRLRTGVTIRLPM